MNLKVKRNKLRKKSLILHEASFVIDSKNKKDEYKKSEKLRKRQGEVYKKWKFYDNFIQAMEEENGNTNERL